ncbi:sensor histidine kinase [Bacillus sp. JCM 19034]|uniref:cache domain-containing sensor histidine kinase n=1 Tax=Bacillus sp. JCM 19034 TaxID=1481928 RepID=UPI0007859507|nr:sensor histidine kinase [Bacillus sp. JCM 19034]
MSSNILKDQISQHMLDTQKAINLNINSIMGEVDLFTEYIIYSEAVQYYLDQDDWETVSEKALLESTMKRLFFSYPYTYDFLLISKNKEAFSFIHSPHISVDTLESMDFFQEVKRKLGAPYWIGPINNTDLVGQDQTLFTIGRSILNPNTLETTGYLFLHIKPEMLRTTDQIAQTSDSEWVILDEKGSVIYSASNELISEDFSLYTKGEYKGGTGSSMYQRGDGKEFLLTHSPTINDWTLISIKSWESVNAQIKPIKNITIILIVGLLILFTFFHRVLTQKLITFFTLLRDKMVQTTEENLEVQMPNFKEPELQTVSNGFNEMVSKLKVMIELVEEKQKQKQLAEFRVLQHQINPHFLYNTLEVVNALASLDKKEEVQKLVTNLGKLLRISLKGPYEISVDEELRHVTSYLEIQRIRYSQQFNYKNDINENVKGFNILKLILQPLVENSIEHGINHETFNFITIRAEKLGDRMLIFVEDNGPGISEESLTRLRTKNSYTKSEGHGVLNVHERLRMFYGLKSGLMICSSDKGTIIRISIPIKKERDDQ